VTPLVEHDPGDLTCTVDGGVTLGELAAHLAPHRQMLALDPPGAAATTVAAALAAAVTGPRAHGYGLPRDLVLGVSLRLPDGRVVHGGGRVVKTVAGYDLPRLVTGSDGLLGEVARACLRLHPLPERTCTVVAAPFDPIALEPLAPACVEHASPDGVMLARFESIAAAELAREAAAIVGGDVVDDDEELWAAHRERALGMPLTRCLPAEVPATIEQLRAAGATAVVGRAALGLLHADVALEPAGPQLTSLERRVVEALAGG
jgi:glycolate oxidase FAD binding subunit